MLDLDVVIGGVRVRNQFGNSLDYLILLILGVSEPLHRYSQAFFVPNRWQVFMKKSLFKITKEIFCSKLNLFQLLKVRHRKEIIYLRYWPLFHYSMEIALYQLTVLVTILLNEALYYNLVRIFSIKVETSYDLALEMEVLWNDEIVLGFELEFMLDRGGVRIVLSKFIEEGSFVQWLQFFFVFFMKIFFYAYFVAKKLWYFIRYKRRII